MTVPTGRRLPGIRRDILANLLGKGWVALTSFVCVPVFVHQLGLEAYGLVGLFVTLQATLVLLDFGFSTALNRAVASAGGGPLGEAVTGLAAGLERLFAGLALLVVLVAWLCAAPLAEDWLRLGPTARGEAVSALRLMGVAIALQLPYLLYAGALAGLGRQVALNGLLAACTTLRFGGAAVLLGFQPDLQVFFGWQVLAAVLQVAWARSLFTRTLRKRSSNPDARPALPRAHLAFAGGVGVTAALGVVLTQLDKLMLSRLLPMPQFAAYSLAWTLASVLLLLAGPVVAAYFPRLSGEASRPDADPGPTYHQGCQVLALAVVPAGVTLVALPGHALALWLGDTADPGPMAALLRWLVLGTLLNTLAQMPHALQLAHGRPQLGVAANLIMVTLVVPSLLAAVEGAGAIGAAWVWVGLNALYLGLGVPLMHRWLLRGQGLHWWLHAALLPATAAAAVVLPAGAVLASPEGRSAGTAAGLLLCYLGAVLATAVAVPASRGWLTTRLRG